MTSEQVALIGGAAVVLAALIGAYASLRSRKPASLFGKRSTLVATARYQWLEQSIMWALPGELSSEAQDLVERSNPFHPSDYTAIESVLIRQGGVKINTLIEGPTTHSEFSPVQLVVQGGAGSPVVIREMRAHILSRQSPISGTLVYGPPQGEGSVTDIAFDLDSNDAVARRVDDIGLPSTPYFASTYLTLQPGESMAFSVRAYTRAYHSNWEIEISGVVNGKDQSVMVRDSDGNPFRTTAFAQSYETVYDLDFEKHRFVRLPPDSDPPWDWSDH
jgi:hypothetical protein